MTGSTWTWLLVGALVLVLLLGRQEDEGAPAPAPGPARPPVKPVPASAVYVRDASGRLVLQAPYAPLPPPPSGGGSGSTSVADRCREVFSYNDPSRYVGHADQRVQAVSTGMSALSTINCGAVGIIEGGVKAVGSWIGGLF